MMNTYEAMYFFFGRTYAYYEWIHAETFEEAYKKASNRMHELRKSNEYYDGIPFADIYLVDMYNIKNIPAIERN